MRSLFCLMVCAAAAFLAGCDVDVHENPKPADVHVETPRRAVDVDVDAPGVKVDVDRK